MCWKRGFAIFLISLFYGCNTAQTIPVQNLEASPAGTAVQFFYKSQGGNAEGYLIRPKGNGPFPLVVLLHGHSWRREGAKRIIPVAEKFSTNLCYASLAISLPGYGMTKVAGDRNRDRDIIARVILDGISKVSGLPWVDGTHVMLYGFSRGATFAATLAGKVQGLRSVVLHSGAYDIGRLYRDTSSAWVRRTLNPNGEVKPHLFSVLPEVSGWTAPTLILHGAKDQLVPTSQAFLLRDRLATLGKPHRFVIFPHADHRLPPKGVREEVLSFLNQYIGSACLLNDP
ncbi:MAG: alpha/beta hydrolase family protein [Candidatus Binatia bacterium]